MATSYSVVSNRVQTTERAAVFAVGETPNAITFHAEASQAYLFTADAGDWQISMHRFAPTTVSGSLSAGSRAAVFSNGAFPSFVLFYYNGANSYLFCTRPGASSISFWRFNPATVSGSGITSTATIEVGSNVNGLAFYYNGSTSWLFSGDGGSNTVSWHEFNPDTISGTISSSARKAVINVGEFPRYVSIHYTGSTLYLCSGDFNDASISFYRLTASTSGTVTTASRAALFQLPSQPSSIKFHYNGSTSYLFSTDQNSSTMSMYRFNPDTISGTQSTSTRAATFATGGTPRTVNFYYNGANSLLTCVSSAANTIEYYNINPDTVSGTITTASRAATFDVGSQPYGVVFQANGANSYLATVENGSNSCSFYRSDMNLRTLSLTLSSSQLLTSSAPIIKTTTAPLTLSSSVDYFTASLYLRAGSQVSGSGLGNLTFNYQFSPTDDSAGTLSEDFVFSGSTAAITGNYRITMDGGSTTTLGSKAVYNDSFTISSGSELALTQNSELGSNFILSSGAIVSGPYTLTIPYADPGVTLSGGATLIAPQPTITFDGLLADSEVRLYRLSDDYELGGIENSSTSFSVGYSYSGSPIAARYIVIKIGYEVIDEEISLTSSSNTIPIRQRVDRIYSDP